MEITDLNIRSQLLPILRSISDATFVAIDVEMSGISTRRDGVGDRSRNIGKPNLQQQYEESKEAAEKYQILQLGITCIEEDRENDMYVARPYNFNVTPLFLQGDKLDINRDITLSSSAIHFLQKNSFDLGKVFTRGVPYLSREEEIYARQRYAKRQDDSASIPDIIISESDHAALEFCRKTRETLSEWTNAKRRELEFVNIGVPGGLNGYQRRLVHQIVRNEFPGYRSFARNNGDFMQIEKLDKGREAQVALSKRESFEGALAKQIGIRHIIDALVGGDLDAIDPKWFSIGESGEALFIDLGSKRKELDDLREKLKDKVHTIVGHNLFTDLIFIYKTFIGKLPKKVSDFNKHIHALFPRVIDTKYLATHAAGSSQIRSRLKDLCDELQSQRRPFIALAEKHMEYGKGGKEHEAGYDSWMTAQVLLKLSAKLAAEQQTAKLEHNELSKLRFESEAGASDQEGATLNPPGTDEISNTAIPKLQSLENYQTVESNGTHSSKMSAVLIPKRNTKKLSRGSRFDQLPVEGREDSDSGSSSPERGNGGVLLAVGERKLGNNHSEVGIKDAAKKRAAVHRQRESSNFLSGPTKFYAETTVPDEMGRYYSASQLKMMPSLSEDPDEPRQWIPHINGPWWRVYWNRLRVYGTETEVCRIDD